MGRIALRIRKPSAARKRGRRIIKVARPERTANKVTREQLAEGVARRITNEFDGIRQNINLGRLEGMIGRGVQGLDEIFVELGFPEALEPIDADLRAAIVEGVQAGSKLGEEFSDLDGVDIDPERIQQAALQFVAEEGVERIAGINANTQQAVRATISEFLATDLTPQAAAMRIGRSVGLTPRDARALSNFEAQLVQQRIGRIGPEADTQLVRETIARDVERYRDRLLNARGMSIAETEIQNAIQHGERAFWEEALVTGQAEVAPEKQWWTVNDARVCPICEPLHKEKAAFNESFQSPLGWSGLRPPAHPRCRCYVKYTQPS